MRYMIVLMTVIVMIGSGCGADRYQVRMNQAQSFMNQKQYDDARIEIMNMIKEHPQDPVPYYMLAEIHYRQGMYSECLFNLEEADRRGLKPSREYYLMRGISHFQTGDMQSAADTFETMPAASSSGTVQKYLGIIYTRLGKYEDAVAAFDGASEMDRDAAALAEKGKALFRTGNTSQALATYQKALGIAPDDDEILFQAAALSMLSGKDADAFELFGRIKDGSPYHAQAQYNRAEAAIRLGDYPVAITILGIYLGRFPDDSAARINLASALIKTGEYASAADLLSALLEREYSVRAAYNLALANYKLGKYRESASLLAPVVEEYPDDAAYRYAYGLSLSASGDMAAAAQQMSAALVLDPSLTDARSWLESHAMTAP